MLPELGHISLILALCFATIQCLLPLIGSFRHYNNLMQTAKPLAMGQSVLVFIAFATLLISFLNNDFSVSYIAANSNTHLPLFYKITAIWSAHEGSLLLWVTILAVWTCLVCRFSHSLPLAMQARVLAVMGAISFGFLLFMLLTSNPFLRIFPAPLDGNDLNPLLQDPGLVIHPPMLYMGYVGMSVAFAFAIAALLSGKLDATWARWSLPWTIAAWCFLTFGIVLGSWWSYRDLGWGGWWFWDPVENASFMPWLVATALIHSLIVTEKRGAFKNWTVLLAITAFSLSLIGTFLVRSGILTSVHAFAVDPTRGAFMLKFLALVVGLSLTLYAWRAPSIGQGGVFALLSRESMLLANNVLLFVLMATVFLGTVYPLVLDALGIAKISVGPPYFDTVFVPLSAVLFFFMGLAPACRWQVMPIKLLWQRLISVALLSIALAIALPYLFHALDSVTVVLGLTLAFWILLATLQDAYFRWQPLKHRLFLNSNYLAMIIAHMGVAITIIGITLTIHYSQETQLAMTIGKPASIGPYQLILQDINQTEGPNYKALNGTFMIVKQQQYVATITAEKRLYNVSRSIMSIPAIDIGLTRDIYVALGDPIDKQSFSVRLYYKPFVRWIWLGGLLMVLGGIIALCDQRWRKQ